MGSMDAVPVIVGVGQVANKDPDRLRHPVELLEEASRRAVADAGAGADLLPDVGMVLSSPLSVFSDDDGGALRGRAPRDTAGRAGPGGLQRRRAPEEPGPGLSGRGDR